MDDEFAALMAGHAREIEALALKLAEPTADTGERAQVDAHANVILDIAAALILRRNIHDDDVAVYCVRHGPKLAELIFGAKIGAFDAPEH